MTTYDNIQKITLGQGDNYITVYLLNYNCYNKHYKMNAVDLTKQQTLDTDSRAIQQINFSENLS